MSRSIAHSKLVPASHLGKIKIFGKTSSYGQLLMASTNFSKNNVQTLGYRQNTKPLNCNIYCFLSVPKPSSVSHSHVPP